MGKAMNVVKRRSSSPHEACGLVGYWLGLFFQQTRLFHWQWQLGKIKRHVGGMSEGDMKGIAAPILPDIVVRDRLKASKGNEQSVESYLDILVRSVVHFKQSPRVCLFGLICGLFPDKGFDFAPNTGLVLAAALKQVSRDVATFDVSQLSKGDTCWLSSDVAEGVLRNLFNGEPNWNLEHWKSVCSKYGVAPMWNDPVDRRVLNDEVAASTTLVGEIEPKDRRSCPDLKNSVLTRK